VAVVATDKIHIHVRAHARAQIERYLESKAIAEELGDRWREANACNDLGFCYGKMGEYAKAVRLSCLRPCLSIESVLFIGTPSVTLVLGAFTANPCTDLVFSLPNDTTRARAHTHAHTRTQIKLYLQSKAMHEELGNPKGVALVCGRLGICYGSTGEYEKAFALHETCKAINEKLGDRWGVAMACSNLGNCFQLTGDYVRARSLYEEQRATFEEMGDRAGVAAACCNLGNCDMRTGDIERALMLHGEHKTIAQELGDLAGVSMACCNIGKCHQSDGNFERALVLHLQAREISETLGHREGVALASSHLGHCHCSLGDYSAAISSYKTQYAVAIEMHLEEMKTRAALGLGVAMRLQLRADLHVPRVNLGMRVGADVEIHSLSRRPELNGVRGKIIEPQDPGTGRCGVKTATGIEVALKTVNIRLVSQLTGPAAGASYVPSPADAASPLFGPPSSLARLEERVQEAAEWLQMALNTGSGVACFHVALLAFDAGHEDKALARLEEYLTWVVENGRQSCAGCQQKRNEQAPMLTCNGCRVVRFCDADHQKMASKNIMAGGNLWQGRHKDICGLLGKWRGVVKNGVSRESLQEDLLAFLRQ